MWLKSVTLDGFKSYATRTIVGPFDSAFTAITGLNGTGKSNVLDAICFVLGITNLSQVRVGSLSELVYKQGQSGVTQATVTLLFDNSDASRSPVGYASMREISVTRQVILGGRNKYLINGCQAQLARVVNLFQSVGLNVNNPHFLIMQGRITKVINMKPVELLALVEEAAGTRMFEAKKQAAQRTMSKKQAKVDEINAILSTEIGPQLQALQRDQDQYELWQKKRAQLGVLNKLAIAAQFTAAVAAIECAQRDRAESDEASAHHQQKIAEQDQLIAELDRQLATLSAQSQASNTASTAESALETELSDASRLVVQSTAAHANTQASIERDQMDLAMLQQQLTEIRDKRSEQSATVSALVAQFASSESIIRTLEVALERCQSAELGFATGGESTGQASAGGVHSQLMQSQQSLATLESQRRHKEGEIRELQRRATSSQSNSVGDGEAMLHKHRLARKAELEREIASVTEQLSGMSVLCEERSKLEAALSVCNERLAQLESEFAPVAARAKRFEFSYSPPHALFDQSAVHGRVASLVSVTRPEARLALEIAAGKRLNHVVVDTETVGAELLSKGQLKQRVTIIPINKIQSHCIEPATINRAKQLVGAEKVHAALACVSFDARVRPAVESVFGSTLIAKDMNAASAVCFHREVAKRTVTLDGDVVDPRGSMEGGSVQQQSSMLDTLQHFSDLRAAIESKQRDQAQLHAALEAMKASEQERRSLEGRLAELKHALSVLSFEIAASPITAAQQQDAAITAEIASLEADIRALSESIATCQLQIARLEAMLADTGSSTKKLKAEIVDLSKQLNQARAQHQQLAQAKQRAENETAAIDDEMKTTKASIATLEAALAEARSELGAHVESVTREKKQYDRIHTRLIALQFERNAANTEHQRATKAKAVAVKQRKALEIEAKKRALRAQKSESETAEYQRALAKLEKDNPWIASEKAQFGQSDSDYDFTGYASTAALVSAAAALSNEVSNLGRRINKKALGMYDACASDYGELQTKKAIIETDKDKIEHVIAQLEAKKKVAVSETWTKVNRDFGAIFGSLLPGVFAALQPVSATSLELGLEMKVSFNGQWKQSLSELSGGQRSLLALSFILALLLFKPAPMYILDEIDAALDLSHTQNIGAMLKAHFPHSQFIIVSLKEGMFQNANVLFRTQLSNGVSAVTRTQSAAPTAASSVAKHRRPVDDSAGHDKENTRTNR